jgi:hypothetical protein
MTKDLECHDIPRASDDEKRTRQSMLHLFKTTPIPEVELLDNLGLFVRRQHTAGLLALTEIYRMILDVQGIVCEFGVRWGRNLALFSSLRGIFEPYNFYRRIVGFDTFSGYPSVGKEDGAAKLMKPGAFDVVPNYKNYLEELMTLHEKESPLAHIRRFELREGDASTEVQKYLEQRPETMIALAYFDLDLYEPTHRCLEAIMPYISIGGIVAFDELCHPEFPGETLAFREVLAKKNLRLRRTLVHPSPTYVVIE